MNNTVGNITFTKDTTPIPITLSVKEWLLVMAFVLIMTTGTVGNLFVIYVFGVKKKAKRRSTTEWLILYLGIVDFFSSLSNPMLHIYFVVTRHQLWPFGEVACHILPSLGPVMTSISCGILLILALDRYVAIVIPFKGQFSWQCVTLACLANVVLSILSFLHYSVALVINPSNKRCQVPDVSALSYGLPNCLFIVFRLATFALVFSVTNVMIFRTLQRRRNTSTVRELRVMRDKQSQHVMRVLFVMGVVFTVLVFPRELFYLVFNFSWLISDNGLMYNSTLLTINAWLKVMHTANSCANVLIYSHMQTLFRKQIFKALTYFGCCKEALAKQNMSYNNTLTTPLVTRREMSLPNCVYKNNGNDSGSSEIKFFKRAQNWKLGSDKEPFL